MFPLWNDVFFFFFNFFKSYKIMQANYFLNLFWKLNFPGIDLSPPTAIWTKNIQPFKIVTPFYLNLE